MTVHDPSRFGPARDVEHGMPGNGSPSRTCLNDGFLIHPAEPGVQQTYVGAWPRVDIDETETAYRATAEIPGFARQDLVLAIADNALLLSGTSCSARTEGDAPFAFQRTIAFDEEVDPRRIEATFADNMLTVILTKDPAAEDDSWVIPIVAPTAKVDLAHGRLASWFAEQAA